MTRRTLFPKSSRMKRAALLSIASIIFIGSKAATQGVPVVFLHGGPGAGPFPPIAVSSIHVPIALSFRPAGRRTFDTAWKLADNTTVIWLRISKSSAGTSGSIVGLCSAAPGGRVLTSPTDKHPDHCLGLVLRGIFLCRKDEIDWFMYGMRRLFQSLGTFANYLPYKNAAISLETTIGV